MHLLRWLINICQIDKFLHHFYFKEKPTMIGLLHYLKLILARWRNSDWNPAHHLREPFIDEGRVTKNLPSRCGHQCLVHTGARCLLSENHRLQYQHASSGGKGKSVRELVLLKLHNIYDQPFLPPFRLIINAILHIPPVTILEESMLALAADYLAMINWMSYWKNRWASGEMAKVVMQQTETLMGQWELFSILC